MFVKKESCLTGKAERKDVHGNTSTRGTAWKLFGWSMLCILSMFVVWMSSGRSGLTEDKGLVNGNKLFDRNIFWDAVSQNVSSLSFELSIRSKRSIVIETNNVTDGPDSAISSTSTLEPEPTFETTSQPQPTSEPEPISESEPTSEPELTPEPASEPSAQGQAEPEIHPNSTAEPTAEPGPPVKKIVFIAILSVLFVLILLANTSLVMTIVKSKPLRKPANVIILSVGAADICVALFVITGMISAQFSESYMVNIICKICHYASHMSLAAASLSLVAVAGDRVKAIARPLKPKMTMGQAGGVVAVVWVLSCAYGFRVPFLFEVTPVQVQDDYGQIITRMICAVPVADAQRNAPLVVLDFVIVFALPAITITVSYICLLYFLSKNSMKMNGAVSGAKKNKKALRLSIFMIAMFIFCHMPVHTFRLYLSRDHAIVPESFDMIRAFDIISIMNSVLNPIVYGFLNKQIRDGFLDVMGRNDHRQSRVGHNRVHPTGQSGVDTSKIATIIVSETQQTTTSHGI